MDFTGYLFWRRLWNALCRGQKELSKYIADVPLISVVFVVIAMVTDTEGFCQKKDKKKFPLAQFYLRVLMYCLYWR